MLKSAKSDAPAPKCYFTHSLLPAFVDAHQPPPKRKPFSTFLSHPHTHTADLILPEEIYDLIRHELEGDLGTIRYSKVYMKLGEIIEGDFFTEYIKKGNVAMLSEGRPGVDNVFLLRDGIMRLEIDKATYERCGLQGTPIPDGGRKHVKNRFAIELNLRLPSMLHGKKGFRRIEWAFKNVLHHTVAWLFCDLSSTDIPEKPIAKHQPIEKTVSPLVTRVPSVRLPPLKALEHLDDQLYATEVHEWLGLVSLKSPRITASDDIDPYLSRYQVPDFDMEDERESEDKVVPLVKVSWRGFVQPKFLIRLWLLTRKHVGEQWAALNVCCFRGQAYSVLGVGTRDIFTLHPPKPHGFASNSLASSTRTVTRGSGRECARGSKPAVSFSL